MIDSTELQKKAADALVEVRAFYGSDAIRAVLGLLDALEDQYKADLEHVTVENLVRLQTALKQINALKRSITANQHLDPKIL